MTANGRSPAIPDAIRIAEKVLPEPVPPARPIRRPTFSRAAGLNSKVMTHLLSHAPRAACTKPRDMLEPPHSKSSKDTLATTMSLGTSPITRERAALFFPRGRAFLASVQLPPKHMADRAPER